MTVPKLIFAEFGNGKRDNIIFELDAAESVTCYFKASGINTASAKYYDLKFPAKQVLITVNNVASITEINGGSLQSPRTLGTDVPNTFRKGIEWNSITVRADSDSTFFEIYAS